MSSKLSLTKGISQQDLPGILAESGEGIVSLDQNGRVLGINSEGERLLGWSAGELLDQDFFACSRFSLQDDVDLDTAAVNGKAAFQSISCAHLNVNARMVRKDGESIPVAFTLTSVLDQERVIGKLLMFRQKPPKSAEQLALEVVNNAASIIVKLDADGEVVLANQHSHWLFGKTHDEELVPATIRALLKQSPHLLDQQTLLDRRQIRGQKKELCIAWSVSVQHDQDGKVSGAICVGNDFTDHHHSLKGQMHDSLLTQKVFENISDGIITVDLDGRVVYLNPIAEQMTGWSSQEAAGHLIGDIYEVTDEKTSQPVEDPITVCLRAGAEVAFQGNRVLARRGGWEFIVRDSATPLHDIEGNVSGAVLVFCDVSELRGMERWLEYESSHDTLTGLLNRRQFENQLMATLEACKAEDRQHALVYIDLDQFKLINDSYGLVAGDQLLKEIASIFIGNIPEGDNLARLGGDEFGIILHDCSPEQAKRKAKLLCRAVRDYCFMWEDKPFDVGVSIGLVPINAHLDDLSEVMRMAESACYVAKEQGRNRVHLYRTQDLLMRQRDGELLWIQRIRQALQGDRFRLYCQNIVPLGVAPGHATHYEILLRMIHDDGTVLRPAVFISAAERYHLMPAIDRWVITHTLKLLSERRLRSEQGAVFSINISGQSLDDEQFLGFVVDQLHNCDVPAESICFEITETTAACNLMVVRRFMAVLRGMGCRFALDDFGRGVSSFAYLKNLDVDYLKIDGMFVRDLVDDEVGHAMVESINHIGHVMGVQTIAEFVETQAVLEKLVSLGVDHVQGYQLGQPRPLMPAFRSGGRAH